MQAIRTTSNNNVGSITVAPPKKSHRRTPSRDAAPPIFSEPSDVEGEEEVAVVGKRSNRHVTGGRNTQTGIMHALSEDDVSDND